MPTKTYDFTGSSQGLTDQGPSTLITSAYDGANGNPAGSYKFVTSQNNLTNEKDQAYRGTTGETWQTWGVGAGQKVTQIRINLDRKAAADVNSTVTINARVVNSSGVTVSSAQDPYSESVSGAADNSWLARNGVTVNVDAAYQNSATDVRLELEVIVTSGNSGTNVSVGLDNIAIVMTTAAVSTVGEIVASTNVDTIRTRLFGPARNVGEHYFWNPNTPPFRLFPDKYLELLYDNNRRQVPPLGRFHDTFYCWKPSTTGGEVPQSPILILDWIRTDDRIGLGVVIHVAATGQFHLNHFMTPDQGASKYLFQQITSSPVTVDGGTPGYTQSAKLIVASGWWNRVEVANPNLGTTISVAFEYRRAEAGMIDDDDWASSGYEVA